jgi:hypothetical protein
VVRTSRRSPSPSAGVRQSIKTCKQLEKPAKPEIKSRTLLTNWPVGSISCAHRAMSSQRPDLGSMARRTQVAANARGKGSGSSRDIANAMGPRSRSSRRCGAASPSRGRLPQSGHGPPAPSARSRANPAAPGAGAGTPRGTRKGASPGAPCRCRGKAGLGVAEIEPPPLPVRVVGGHRIGDVLLLALGPHGERHAAGARRAAGPQL